MRFLNKMKKNLVKVFAALVLALGAISIVQTVTSNNTNQTAQAAVRRRRLSRRERAAKHWIAIRESGGSYRARNGVCYGRYQLNIAYLHGNLSPRNQERVADNYVYGRYGSWVNAKRFWLRHHWY